MERLGGHAKGGGETVADLAGVGRVGAPAGDAVVGAQAQPRGEVFGGGELAHVGAYFCEECQGCLDAHAFDGGQVDPELGEEVLTHRLLWRLDALFDRRRGRSVAAIFQRTHVFVDLLFALAHELLVEAPRLEGLAQGEEVLLAPVAQQRLGDLGLALLAAGVAVAGEHPGVALARHDCVEDREAGDPGDVGDGVVQLHVHLIERLLDAQEVVAAGAHEALAVAHQGTHRADCGGRPEGCVEQSHAVQVLQPLAVLHVTLAPWHVLDMARVDQADLEAAALQDLEKRDPVDPGGLHRYGGDLTGSEPICQCLEILGEGSEVAHRLRVAIRGHRHVVDRGPEVDAGGVGVHLGSGGWRFRRGFLFALAVGLSGHDAVGLGCAS